jgi:dTDP-4-amino-4,6-dideoxygalactose transaminase
MDKTDFVHEDYARDADGQINPWYYEMREVGCNYRMTEIQAALGRSQLRHLGEWVGRRNQIASHYRELIKARFPADLIRPLECRPNRTNAYHLFVLQIAFDRLGQSRATVMNRLRERGIGTQVHYIPVHLQPYYRDRYEHVPGDFPGAEKYYQTALSIPMYPSLTDDDLERVVDELANLLPT